MVEVAQIIVPRERVTSVWDPQIEEEFKRSIETKGFLEPVQLLEIDGELWLTDGLHRLEQAEKLKIPSIPAIIKKGTAEDLLIENLIRNRQRGKSNPAQEAEVLDQLVNRRGFPLQNAAHQLGLSPEWAQKLLKIASLPEEIKDLLKLSKIPVTGGFYLADLTEAGQQIQVARDASEYGYTAFQIKARVTQLLNPDYQPKEGETTFAQNGTPQRIPLRCRFCAKELPDVGKQYIWVCPDCEQEAADLMKNYHAALAAAQKQEHGSTPVA